MWPNAHSNKDILVIPAKTINNINATPFQQHFENQMLQLSCNSVRMLLCYSFIIRAMMLEKECRDLLLFTQKSITEVSR